MKIDTFERCTDKLGAGLGESVPITCFKKIQSMFAGGQMGYQGSVRQNVSLKGHFANYKLSVFG